ncbi:MAG TPA: amidophosphoribosyltransferase [Candidatus Thermoplasmatota archaeon]|nr:amidophosphoribosyltransferase [Candidatus Thermoplasmatota archaeon]
MEMERKEKCGVAGVVLPAGHAAPLLYYALMALQHRGQESAGIVVHDAGATRAHRGMGLVENVFSPEVLARLTGSRGIGHVRYSTTGGSVIENAQPVLVSSAFGDISLGHNGDIANSRELRESLQAKGWAFLSTTDSEVAVRMLANALAETKDPVRAIRRTMGEWTGSYSLALMIGDTVYAVRDPLGIKPLCYGELPGGGFVAASESVALDILGATFVRDLAPGEILEIGTAGVKSHAPAASKEKAHCQFEYVYFARADSVIDGRHVYDVRMRLGEILAKEAPVSADIVTAVPDSGRTHALGFAQAAGIPFAEGLMKNRYVHRTFIMPGQEHRQVGVKLKLNAVPSVVKGKRVVLVDDSIVRGTTMRRIVQMLRDAGAREVHVRIGSPPIKSPCYLGIDMPTREELVASSKSIPEIAAMIGADSLAYLSEKGLVEAIGIQKRDLCLGCLTGEYPVKIPGEKVRGPQELPA